MATKKAAKKGKAVGEYPRFRSCERMGWRPDLPDARDFYTVEAVHALPTAVDLRTTGFFPKVYDQGQFGSCTGNAISAALAFAIAKQKETAIVPSRFFIYREERVIEGDVADDNGAQIRDGLKVISKLGAPDEKMWSYTASHFAAKPPAKVYADALKHRATRYARVNNRAPHAALSVLAAGFPIVFGFSVYESFESDAVAATGVVPMPGAGEQIVGGHAVVAVGYDQASSTLLVRNSWGAGWGGDGYFTMPFPYAFNKDLSDDWWTVTAEGV